MNKVKELAMKLKEAIDNYCTEKKCDSFNGCEGCPANELYNKLEKEISVKYAIKNIEWDTEEDEDPDQELPDEVVITTAELVEAGYLEEDDMNDEDILELIADDIIGYLSDKYEYFIKECKIEKIAE